MGKTKIEWADKVWNPVVGCTPVSEGCRHCYAKRVFERFHSDEKFTDVKCLDERLDTLAHWRKPSRIFVNSMSDLFHPDVPEEFIWRVFNAMTCGNRRHTYMILTKRPERMKYWFEKYQEKFWHFHAPGEPQREFVSAPWPDPCMWLGVSVEDQKTADERIPLLLKTPAAVRFVSVEPMLGVVDLSNYLHQGVLQHTHTKIDWVICGGESGPGARPMNPEWVRWLRDQCWEAGNTPFFFKQWGDWKTSIFPWFGNDPRGGFTFEDGIQVVRVGKKAAGRTLDGYEWNQFPERRDHGKTTSVQ